MTDLRKIVKRYPETVMWSKAEFPPDHLVAICSGIGITDIHVRTDEKNVYIMCRNEQTVRRIQDAVENAESARITKEVTDAAKAAGFTVSVYDLKQ